jgi:hypothetical protein
VTVGSNSGLIDISSYPNGAVFSVEAQPTGGANGVYKIQHINEFGFGATDISVTNIFTQTSAINISAVGTYSFRKNQFVTHLRFTYVSGTGSIAVYKIRAFSESYWNQTIPVSISSVTIGNTVTVGSLPAISGTVTANNLSQDIYDGANDWKLTRSAIHLSVGGGEWQAVGGEDGAENPIPISGTVTVGAMPSGALTTRFGSVTTANTAQLTSAVTNTSRKYLLVQNIATSAVTIGIGFAPTTTQGIQLTAGAGLTFDAFCPTGGVWWLSSTTGSNFSILEG